MLYFQQKSHTVLDKPWFTSITQYYYYYYYYHSRTLIYIHIHISFIIFIVITITPHFKNSTLPKVATPTHFLRPSDHRTQSLAHQEAASRPQMVAGPLLVGRQLSKWLRTLIYENNHTQTVYTKKAIEKQVTLTFTIPIFPTDSVCVCVYVCECVCMWVSGWVRYN